MASKSVTESVSAAKSALTRRALLTRGSMTVAAAGVVGAFPALPNLATTAAADAPAVEPAAESTESFDGPLIAHVLDVNTGQISFYSGETEVSVFNPALAAQLARAAR